MKCISDKYNIYLTDDNTLLFYDTLEGGGLDNPRVEIENAADVLIDIAEIMVEKTQDEIFEIVCEWYEKNEALPDVLKTMLYHMIWHVEIKESEHNECRETA